MRPEQPTEGDPPMGLDITLGILVLLGGIRGWIKGFLLQAIQVGALIGSIFLADPIRDLARPYLAPHLPSLQPALIDRMLWWAAAVLGYIVISGVPSSLVRLIRSRPAAELDARWGDCGIGFLLGAAKGLVFVSFLTWGLQSFAVPRYAADPGWIGKQLSTSRGLELARRHEPGRQIWTSEPVQLVVDRVRTRGLGAGSVAPAAPDATAAPITDGPAIEAPPAASARAQTTKVPAQIPPIELDPEVRAIEDLLRSAPESR
jgi:uncharacterized membrane protein required for colicin V production